MPQEPTKGGSQFFEERKYDRSEFDGHVSTGPTNSTKGILAAGASNDQRLWSRKMDQKKGQPMRITKGLGSTSHYLGDMDDSSFAPKREDKVAIVKDPEEEERKRAAKDKAVV